MTTAATRSPEKSALETTIRSASASPKGTCVQRLSGRNGSRKTAFDVPPSEPSDLPWKAPIVPTKWWRPVVRIAIFRQASIDSVPEFVKKEYWRSPGVISATRRARYVRSGSISSCEWIACFSSWSWTAFRTFGWRWPVT
jgi:hypothetical protein